MYELPGHDETPVGNEAFSRHEATCGGLEVTDVKPDSAAARAGVQVGDVLLAANGTPLQDVIQLRYETSEPVSTLALRRGERLFELEVVRDFGEELGLVFRSELADGVHTCNNKCVFCFIHQMPKRMRRSLYLMDDDYRLSFLHGNYVTLTNLSEGEFDRICREGLSPMYVSVHATDPQLRGRMLGRKGPAPILDQLKALAKHGIASHAQVVLCPGWNDGEALEQTVRELAALHPAASGKAAGVLSVAVVPVGLTKYRERLTPLRPVDSEYSRAFLDLVEEWRIAFRTSLGTAFVFPSDEWFYYAGRRYPPRKWYEDFPQFGNGIGTCRRFLDDARRILRRARPPGRPVVATILTARLPEFVLRSFAERLSALEGVSLEVRVVDNEFFGPRINVAGLMTSSDMLARMRQRDVQDTVFVPDVCVSSEGLLLDDLPVEQLSTRSGKMVKVVPSNPEGLARAVGVLPEPKKSCDDRRGQ